MTGSEFHGSEWFAPALRIRQESEWLTTFGAVELSLLAVFRSRHRPEFLNETGVAEVVMARKGLAVLRIFATSDALPSEPSKHKVQ